MKDQKFQKEINSIKSVNISQEEQLQEARRITKDFWSEYLTLSRISKVAYLFGNEWGYKFSSSILHQLGYPNAMSNTDFDSMEEAEKNWIQADGSFPYLYSEPKRISTLSVRQQQIISKMNQQLKS